MEAHGYIPLTPPRPREEAEAIRVILDQDIDVDFTEYFTDSEDEDEGDGGKPWVPDQYAQVDMDIPHDPEELYYSDIEEEGDTQPLNITADAETEENSTLNGTSESAYEGDTVRLQRTQRLPAPGYNSNTEYPANQYKGEPPSLQLHCEAHKRLQKSSCRCAQQTPCVAQHRPHNRP